MIYRPFGETGMQVSLITFGSMHIEENRLAENGVSLALLEALEKGVNTIDTARAYGASESIIGKTLKEWKGERPYLFSKVLPANPKGWRNYLPIDQAFPIETIRASVEKSLCELKVDCIDYLQLHQWHYLWTKESGWREAFQELVLEGKIRYFGVSTQDHEHQAALSVVEKKMISGVQLIYNCFESRPTFTLLPLCLETQRGVIVRGVMDHGGLSPERLEESFKKSSALKKCSFEYYSKRLDALFKTAQKWGIDPKMVATRFCMTPSSVSTLTMQLQEPIYLANALQAVQEGPLPLECFNEICQNHLWTHNFYEK